jgi:hypothetical protein
VPAALAAPADPHHVLGEHTPESWLGEELCPGRGRNPMNSRQDGELES